MGRGVSRFTFRVRYADTDAMGLAYNAAYLVWFEVGRTEWMREKGMPYREVEARGLRLPVVEAHLRFLSGARYDDLLAVETRLQEFRSRRVHFAYRLVHGSRPIAEGWTVHVPVDGETGKPVRIPAWLADALGSEADV